MHATHPTTIHHAPGWLAPLLVALLAVLLVGLAVYAMQVVNLRLLFTPSVNFTPTTQMVERQFRVEHASDAIVGTSEVTMSQLQRVFILEHQADMQ